MMLHLFLFPGGGYVNVLLWDISVVFPLLLKWVKFCTVRKDSLGSLYLYEIVPFEL